MSAAGAAERLRIRVRHKGFPAVGDAPPKLVIENLSLEVPPNGFMALFGPSGCGKSTLLNLVAGLDPDFRGEIALPEPARIGFVFQEPRLLPWLTVEDNLRLVLADDPQSEAKIDLWLAEMGLADVRAVFPTRLSLGMARRVALARAPAPSLPRRAGGGPRRATGASGWHGARAAAAGSIRSAGSRSQRRPCRRGCR